MPELFLGAEVRAGNFTDDKTGKLVNFNNLMMSFVKPSKLGFMVNDKSPLVKVKNTREDILRVFGEMITMQWLKERINWYADVFYDDRKRVSRIMFYGPDDPMGGESPQSPAITLDEGISDYEHTDVSVSPLDDLENHSVNPTEKSSAADAAFSTEAPASEEKKGGKK